MPPHLCQGANILFLPIPPAPSAPRRTSCPAPCFYAFRRAPALHPAPPFEKGVDPKTFSADGQHTFYGRVKNPECRNNGFPGTDLWTPVAVPSVGVLCFRAWREASSENPWVFGDASHLHDLKRLCLFRRDEVPARNTNRPSGFAFTHLKKFLRVPRGVFPKTRPWQGVGRSPTEECPAFLLLFRLHRFFRIQFGTIHA